MTRRKPSDSTADIEQSRRFIEAARELGCEEHLGRFDEAVKAIGKARRPPGTAASDKDQTKDETPK